MKKTGITQLLSVRATRLEMAKKRLAEPIAQLREVERELEQLGAAFQELDQQRAEWDRGWLEWIRRGGGLRRREAFSHHHARMSVREQDLTEQRDDAEERRGQIIQTLSEARTEVLICQRKLEQLERVAAAQRRESAVRAETAEAGDSEEQAIVRWLAARSSIQVLDGGKEDHDGS